MLRLDLQDLKLEGLQKIAAVYGIGVAGLDKDTLLVKVNERMAGGTELVLGTPRRPWWQLPSVVVALISMLVAAAAMCAAFWNASVASANLERTISKTEEDRRDEKRRIWQQVVVYSIVEKGTRTSPMGLAFEDILNKYRSEASTVEGIDLKKENLQELELTRILTDLMALDQIYLTQENKYIPRRTLVASGLDRLLVQDRAKAHILQILATEPGHFTVDELGKKAKAETGITDTEYTTLINELLSTGSVILENGKLTTKGFPSKP